MSGEPTEANFANRNAEPVTKKEIFGWCCFDFANSSYTTIIITVLYSVYFTNVVAEKSPAAGAWWGYALAASQLVVILLAPLLGAIGDLTARKKSFLMFSAVSCSFFTVLLLWTGRGDVWTALLLVGISNFCFAMSENFCASFLPEISTPETAGRISAYGWSFGYMGGLLSLSIALGMFMMNPDLVKWTFPMTGVFFLLCCIPTFLFLRERAVPKKFPQGTRMWTLGWREIFETMGRVSQYKTLAVFLAAFTLFMAGLSAVVAFAAIYADQVLHFTQNETILLFVTLQFSSAVGALGFGFLQDRIGSKVALILSLILWIAVCVLAGSCESKTLFFLIGNLAGLGIGSLQSASRAVVSMLSPREHAGEFFGFWGLFGKLGAVIGYLSLGTLSHHLGYREAVLANAMFFVLGLLILLPLRLKQDRSLTVN